MSSRLGHRRASRAPALRRFQRSGTPLNTVRGGLRRTLLIGGQTVLLSSGASNRVKIGLPRCRLSSLDLRRRRRLRRDEAAGQVVRVGEAEHRSARSEVLEELARRSQGRARRVEEQRRRRAHLGQRATVLHVPGLLDGDPRRGLEALEPHRADKAHSTDGRRWRHGRRARRARAGPDLDLEPRKSSRRTRARSGRPAVEEGRQDSAPPLSTTGSAGVSFGSPASPK